MKNTFIPKLTVRALTQIALLLAAEIILSRFLSIPTPILKISFSFLAIAAIAILYGPFYACAAAGIGDFMGSILFPIGAYFPGFTLTAALSGLVYGLFIYKKQVTFLRLLVPVLIINILFQIVLDTFWLVMITEQSFWALAPIRLTKSIIMIPIQITAIKSLSVILKNYGKLTQTA